MNRPLALMILLMGAFSQLPAVACNPDPTPQPTPQPNYYSPYPPANPKIGLNYIDVTNKKVYVAYDPECGYLGEYECYYLGSYGGSPNDLDTWNQWVQGVGYVPWVSTYGHWTMTQNDNMEITTAGVYTVTDTFTDQNNPPGTGDGSFAVHSTLKVVAVTISPLDYLAYGHSHNFTATRMPSSVPGEFHWYTNSDSGVRFVWGGRNDNTVAYGETVVTTATAAGSIDSAGLRVFFITQPDDTGTTTAACHDEWFPVFRPTISAPGEKQINWDDDNENNKSDRRDSGVPSSGTLVYASDDDFSQITVALAPGNISQGTTVFSLEGESDRAVLWKHNDRTGGKQDGETFQNSALPKTSYLEAIYPDTLDSSGAYSGRVVLKAQCTLDGSTAETFAVIHQVLAITTTFYTVPHEEEYCTNTVAVSNVGVYPNTGTLTVNVNPDFRDDTANAGSGLMRNTVPGYESYPYLKHFGSHWYVDTIARTSDGSAITDACAAKYTPVALSALDKPSSVYIPRLQEEAEALADNNNGYELHWLPALINETRDVRDTGGGGECWLDIYVAYVPPSQRHSSCQAITMRQCLIQLGSVSNIRVSWRE